MQTSYGFTSEFTDPNGLIYLRARHYAPGLGRFITPDPFAGNVSYPASLNPYTYGYNNPVRYTDPSGECVDPVTFAICLTVLLAVTAGGADLYYQLQQNNGNWDCVDWGEVALWATGGAVAGLLVAVALPVILASPDSALDLASLFGDAALGDTAGFMLDLASLAIPGLTGLGALHRAGDTLQTLNRLDIFGDTGRAINTVDNATDARRILVVGENSFEYSTELRRLNSNFDITATSYESFNKLSRKGEKWNFTLPSPGSGFNKLENIDARRLSQFFPANSFDAVIFNHPHIRAGVLTGPRSAELISDFLNSAPNVLRSGGQINITVTQKLLEYDEVNHILSGFVPQHFRDTIQVNRSCLTDSPAV